MSSGCAAIAMTAGLDIDFSEFHRPVFADGKISGEDDTM
jgi:hypothetical protein